MIANQAARDRRNPTASAEQVMAEIRRETYGEDVGQEGWVTTSEYDLYFSSLGLPPGSEVLYVASGSGDPACYLAGKFWCRITGLPLEQEGAQLPGPQREGCAAPGIHLGSARFLPAEGASRLPFDDGSFDALLCVDAISRMKDRGAALAEWRRVVKVGGRILFTDPVVITGAVTSEELAERSSMGPCVFMPLEQTKEQIREAGFELIRCDDMTHSLAQTSGRWQAGRAQRRDALVALEGREQFERLQRFGAAVSQLAAEGRLSRFAFLAE